MIRNGVPDVLRGEVWQYLAKVQIDPELTQTYRLLLGKVIFCIRFCIIVIFHQLYKKETELLLSQNFVIQCAKDA